MNAQNSPLYHSSAGEVLEDLIKFEPALITLLGRGHGRVVAVTPQPSPAFLAEPIDTVDSGVLVVPSNHVDLVGVLKLQGEEEGDDLGGRRDGIASSGST